MIGCLSAYAGVAALVTSTPALGLAAGIAGLGAGLVVLGAHDDASDLEDRLALVEARDEDHMSALDATRRELTDARERVLELEQQVDAASKSEATAEPDAADPATLTDRDSSCSRRPTSESPSTLGSPPRDDTCGLSRSL